MHFFFYRSFLLVYFRGIIQIVESHYYKLTLENNKEKWSGLEVQFLLRTDYGAKLRCPVYPQNFQLKNCMDEQTVIEVNGIFASLIQFFSKPKWKTVPYWLCRPAISTSTTGLPVCAARIGPNALVNPSKVAYAWTPRSIYLLIFLTEAFELLWHFR